MTITIKPLGLFTLVSIDVDLGATPATNPATSPLDAQHRPPVVNTLVKSISSGWLKRMTA